MVASNTKRKLGPLLLRTCLELPQETGGVVMSYLSAHGIRQERSICMQCVTASGSVSILYISESELRNIAEEQELLARWLGKPGNPFARRLRLSKSEWLHVLQWLAETKLMLSSSNLLQLKVVHSSQEEERHSVPLLDDFGLTAYTHLRDAVVTDPKETIQEFAKSEYKKIITETTAPVSKEKDDSPGRLQLPEQNLTWDQIINGEDHTSPFSPSELLASPTVTQKKSLQEASPPSKKETAAPPVQKLTTPQPKPSAAPARSSRRVHTSHGTRRRPTDLSTCDKEPIRDRLDRIEAKLLAKLSTREQQAAAPGLHT